MVSRLSLEKKTGQVFATVLIGETPFTMRLAADQYNLVDVRQPGEYQTSHIPGARLIPLAELSEHAGDIDWDKPTILY